MSVSSSPRSMPRREDTLWRRNMSTIQKIGRKLHTLIKMTGIGIGFLLVLATLFGGDVNEDLRG